MDVPQRYRAKGFSFHWRGTQGFIEDSLEMLSLKTKMAKVPWKLNAKLAAHLLIHCTCLRSFYCTEVNIHGTAHIPTIYLLFSNIRWPMQTTTRNGSWPLPAPVSCPAMTEVMTFSLELSRDQARQFSNMVIGFQGLRTLLNTVFPNINAIYISLLRSKPHHLIASKFHKIKILSPCPAHA